MAYNEHFEIAVAGMFLLLLVVQCWKRKIPTRANRLFHCLLWLELSLIVVSAADGCFARMDFEDYRVLRHGLNIIEGCLGIWCLTLYTDYVLALAHCKEHKVVRIIGRGITTVLLNVLIFSSPWTGFYYVFDENGQVQFGKAYTILVVAFVVIMIWISALICFQIPQHMKKRKKMILVMNSFLLITMVVPLFVQLPFNLLYVYAEFALYVYYLTIQSPDFYIDIRTNWFNMDAFMEVLQEKMSDKKPTACFIIRVRNYTSMNRIYDSERLQTVQKYIGEILAEHVEKLPIYHIATSTYAVIMDNRWQVRALYDILSKRMPRQWMVCREVIEHEYNYYEVYYPDDTTEPEEVMQRIYYACSDHKGHHAAGELIHLQHHALAEVTEGKKIVHLIEKAIKNNSLGVCFQPIYSVEKKRITSVEVLSRLQDESHNFVNPEYFIHIAENNHTIIELSRQMFEKACSSVKEQDIFSLGITDMSINLSVVQCGDEHLVEDLKRIAAKYKIPMNKILFEITESQFMDTKEVRETLYKLKATGAKIALDNFGTGDSNLTNMQFLPVDFVKIDKSLIWSYSRGENHFLSELLPMLKEQNKKIIVEGVESEDHIDILREICGDYLQGYYYSKPITAKELVVYLKNFNSVS